MLASLYQPFLIDSRSSRMKRLTRSRPKLQRI